MITIGDLLVNKYSAAGSSIKPKIESPSTTVKIHSPKVLAVSPTSQAPTTDDAIKEATPTGENQSIAETILPTASFKVWIVCMTGVARAPREDTAQPNIKLKVMMPKTFMSTDAFAMLSGTIKKSTCINA